MQTLEFLSSFGHQIYLISSMCISWVNKLTAIATKIDGLAYPYRISNLTHGCITWQTCNHCLENFNYSFRNTNVTHYVRMSPHAFLIKASEPNRIDSTEPSAMSTRYIRIFTVISNKFRACSYFSALQNNIWPTGHNSTKEVIIPWADPTIMRQVMT